VTAAGSTAVSLADLGAGRCTVAGDLTLATAWDLWRQLQASGLLRSASNVDLGQVAQSDSAGLALLVAWRASCLANGGDLGIIALPQRLAALAQLTNADAMLRGQ
jgi:phospholipid transport system transporter-binding protein